MKTPLLIVLLFLFISSDSSVFAQIITCDENTVSVNLLDCGENVSIEVNTVLSVKDLFELYGLWVSSRIHSNQGIISSSGVSSKRNIFINAIRFAGIENSIEIINKHVSGDNPSHFKFLPSYLNRFTNINYRIPGSSSVKLDNYDITGQKITTLNNRFKSSVTHSLTRNAHSKACFL